VRKKFGSDYRRAEEQNALCSGSRTLVCILLIGLAQIVLTSSSLAQSETGTLVGIVSGPHDERLAGVQVHLSNEDRQPPISETTTDKTGRFEFVGLSPGAYTLDLSLSGWQSKRVFHLDVRAASTLDLSLALSPARSSVQTNASPHLLDRGVEWGMGFGSLSMPKLPTPRRVWSLLESQETSTVTDKLDIGGLETGRPALFGALGASWTENQYTLDGFNVTDPYIPGRPLSDPDFGALGDVTVVTAAKPSLFSGPGANVVLSTPQPPTSLHGGMVLFYSNRTLESDNMNARLIQLGFPGPERLNHLVDVSGDLGGKLPLTRSERPFFVSFSTQQLSKNLGGFGAPIDAHVYHVLAKVTPLSEGAKRLDLLYAGQHILNSREGAEPRIEPDATTRGNDNFHQFQARWRSSPTASSTLDMGFGVTHAIISSGIQPRTFGISTIDLPRMTQSGAAPLSFAGVRTRYEANALFQTVSQRLGGEHSLSFGVNFDDSNITNRWAALGSIEQILVEGAGAEVIQWNTPTQTRQHVQNFALFAQDAWRPLTWLATPFGLRLENSSGRADAASHGVGWTTIEPRAGFVIPVRPRGLVLRASWSRYGHLLQGRYLDFGNASALGGQLFKWQDANGDRQVQPGEVGQLLRVFGGPYSALDSGLRRPFTNEVSLGLEEQFGRLFQARVRFFRRDDHRLIEIVNTGVPFSSYIPTLVIDPGNDGIPGTSDDRVLLLYNRKPDALGKDFFVLTNPPGYRASFKGFELEVLKLFARHWEAEGSFAAMHVSAPTSPGNSVFENDSGVVNNNTGVISALNADPNTLLFATGRTYFDRGFIGKLTAYYQAPYGIRLGAVAKYYDGLPFGRLLFVNGFNQGSFFVRATPRGDLGAFRTQLSSTLDVRVARSFSVKRGNISMDLDFFNLLNLKKDTLEADLTSPTFAKRIPLAIQAPRIIRLGLEWNF
jgi:Carboxypeptidase regulatory-like domain